MIFSPSELPLILYHQFSGGVRRRRPPMASRLKGPRKYFYNFILMYDTSVPGNGPASGYVANGVRCVARVSCAPSPGSRRPHYAQVRNRVRRAQCVTMFRAITDRGLVWGVSLGSRPPARAYASVRGFAVGVPREGKSRGMSDEYS
ncbi:hypothetical protein EVAR_97363_1 [Eumeta japonica]|uniref:Uncharacterized protein n=1 Tax=Eumeta variegata TaxID=151549 RepID=A0A4C1YZX7_EUMVA|nr:hypothetical protein EVAR_97363_1 [Eumeta japonica]